MKALALVPAAVAAILALNINSASSQAACGKEYQVCMDTCSGRPSKGQNGCFQGCEAKNNLCSEKIYGKRPTPQAPAAAAAEPRGPASRDAMAKTNGAAPVAAKEQEQAREQGPANEAKAEALVPAKPEAQPVAEERAPRKRR